MDLTTGIVLLLGSGGVFATWDLLRSRPLRRLEFLRAQMGQDGPAGMAALHEAQYLKHYRTVFYLAPRRWSALLAAYALAVALFFLVSLVMASTGVDVGAPVATLLVGTIVFTGYAVGASVLFARHKSAADVRVVRWLRLREGELMADHMRRAEAEADALAWAAASRTTCVRSGCGHPKTGKARGGHAFGGSLSDKPGEGACQVKGCGCGAFVA